MRLSVGRDQIHPAGPEHNVEGRPNRIRPDVVREFTMTTTRQYRFLLFATLGFVTATGCTSSGFLPWSTASLATSSESESAASGAVRRGTSSQRGRTRLFGRRGANAKQRTGGAGHFALRKGPSQRSGPEIRSRITWPCCTTPRAIARDRCAEYKQAIEVRSQEPRPVERPGILLLQAGKPERCRARRCARPSQSIRSTRRR